MSCDCVMEKGVAGLIYAWDTYALTVKPASPYTWEDIVYGYVTVKYAGEVLLRMDMTSAVVDFDGGALVWGFDQEQTGLFPVGQRVTIYVTIEANDGERTDFEYVYEIKESGVDGTIPISEGENE